MTQVTARMRITEEGFRDADEFVHAEPGDVGEVIEPGDDGRLMVYWPRNESVAECHPDELEFASADEEAA